MYCQVRDSHQSLNPLADLFFPKFCQRDIEKNNKFSNGEFSSSVSHHICKHSKSCNICSASKTIPIHKIQKKLDIHRIVRESGKYNFECCRIAVNEKIDTLYMRQLLRDYKDIAVCDFLQFGFPIGFKGDESKLNSLDQLWKYRNHRGATDFPDEINAFLEKESKNEAILGPFKSNPFSCNLVASPLNSVPKKDTTERRVILDLSFPKNNSINSSIDKDEYLGEKTQVNFPRVDDFIALIKKKGKGCLLFKKDLRRAYRQISIDPSDYHLVSYVWGKHIFCDTVLSMGLKSAARICQRVSNAISFIMFQFGVAILNYLDDLAGAEKRENANFAYNCLEMVLQKCGLEEAPDKASPPSEIMIFLGILFNTITMTVEVTPDRLLEIKRLIDQWLNKESVTLKQIQSLLGKLNFVAACVKPSRIFVSRLLNWLRSIYHSSDFYHSIPDYVKKDLEWWHRFLPLYNGISMMEFEQWSAPDAIFSSDSCLCGCGGFWNGKYFHVEFPSEIIQQNLHITALEMLSIIICLKLWARFFKGQKIVVLCDNQAVSQVINSGKSKSEFLQNSLREICFLTAINEFQLKGQFIEGITNRIPDVLSRWHLSRQNEQKFMELTENFEIKECLVGTELFEFVNDW